MRRESKGCTWILVHVACPRNLADTVCVSAHTQLGQIVQQQNRKTNELTNEPEEGDGESLGLPKKVL